MSVIKGWSSDGTKVVAFGSFYDSLNPAHQPSAVISGEAPGEAGSLLVNVEAAFVLPYLFAGYTVVIADTEGPRAELFAGPAYGYHTLDGLRAAFQADRTGITADAKVALAGYSGGALATQWAAQLAPEYAPDMNRRLVGATMGGTAVDPRNLLRYVDGSFLWSGALMQGIIGVTRAFDIDLRPYLTSRGLEEYEALNNASILDGLFRNIGGVRWNDLVASQYATPDDIPELQGNLDQLVMGVAGTPTIPLQIAQGTAGETEGTTGNLPGIGPGDGIAVAGDVRTLARSYCDRGVPIDYTE
ncbi:MAG: hypothetical protein KDB08_10290, partial [Microthrixaceae bacterium]|nr:hypothetical protein [Microthrixaceae bacterium]